QFLPGLAGVLGHSLFRLTERSDDAFGVLANCRSGFCDSRNDTAVRLVKDLADFGHPCRKRLCTLLDASGKLQVGALEDAAEIGSPGGKGLGRLADALAEGLVCALEVAQYVAGTLCQRLRRLHCTRDQPLVGRV